MPISVRTIYRYDVCIWSYTALYKYVYICVYVHTHAHIRAHTHICIYIYMYIHVYRWICLHICIQYSYILTYKHTVESHLQILLGHTTEFLLCTGRAPAKTATGDFGTTRSIEIRNHVGVRTIASSATYLHRRFLMIWTTFACECIEYIYICILRIYITYLYYVYIYILSICIYI